jgi:TP901 family phage tail tape measure protein
MTAARSVVYRITADVTQGKAAIASFSASVKKSADDLTAATKEGEKYRRGLDSLGSAAGKVGLVAAAGIGAAVVKAADFDQAMSNVSAATGETTANMERLREAALEAGASTAFSATEAADGIEQLAKAGVATGDILNGGLMGALDLAAAGQLEVGEAAEIASKAMTQFGLAGDQVPHIADLLASAAGNASGEVSDFGQALAQSGLVADQVGLTLEETTGGLAAFASAGLLGSDAGTSFKQTLAALTPNSKKAAKEMEALGLSAFDSQGNFIGLAEFAGKLQGSLGDLTDEQRQATLETIFGSDAVRAASVLYEQGADGIQKWIDTVDDQGAAARIAGERLENLKGDLEELGGALETALIGTGDSAQGPLRAVVQQLTDVVNAYNELPPAAKTGTAAIAGTVAVVGGGLWAFSKAVQGIANTREALSDLGATSGRTGRALRGAGRAASTAGALFAGLAVVDAAQGGLKDYTIGVEAMTEALLELADAEAGAKVTQELKGIEDTIARLADPNAAQALQDNISDAIGGIGGGSELREARAQIEGLDAALVSLVSGGNADVAAESLENLGLSGSEMKDLLTLLPGYGEALKGAANDIKLTEEQTEGLTKAQERSERQTEKQAEALKEAREAARDTAAEFVTLGDGLSDSKVSLSDWIKQLAEGADAMRNFRVNAETAADNGLDKGLIASLRDAGEEGALRMKQLANATEEEIAAANRAWRRGQREAKLYEEAVIGANDAGPVLTKVKVLKDAAMEDLYRLREFKIGDKTIRIHTQRVGGGGEVDYMSGRGFAGGGYTGAGGKYEPAGVVHRGEYVFDAKATKGNEAYLASLHQSLRGYAGGGLVGGGVPTQIDYQRLAGALAELRPPQPLYGDVHMQPHNYSEFKRQMLDDQRRRGFGAYA